MILRATFVQIFLSPAPVIMLVYTTESESRGPFPVRDIEIALGFRATPNGAVGHSMAIFF